MSTQQNDKSKTDKPSASWGWYLASVVAFALAFVSWWAERERDSTIDFSQVKPNASMVERLETALIMDPTNHQLQYNLGIALQHEGKLDEAITAYERAIEITDSDPRYHNNLAATLAQTERLEAAERHFLRAIELDPECVECRLNYGNLLFQQQRFEQAERQFRRIVQIQPEHAQAHNNLAVVLKERGLINDAYKHIQEAMRLKKMQQSEAGE